MAQQKTLCRENLELPFVRESRDRAFVTVFFCRATKKKKNQAAVCFWPARFFLWTTLSPHLRDFLFLIINILAMVHFQSSVTLFWFADGR
jgi:hypothetical protein